MSRRLRIAQVAPPLEPVPPPGYGGTERVIAALVEELDRRGHDVTTFAAGDSEVPGRLVPTVPAALWQAGRLDDPSPWFMATITSVLDRIRDFDVVHSHLEWYSPLLAHASSVPVAATFHGRLDLPWARSLLLRSPGHPVAISRSQAATHPDVRWGAVIHNGLPLAGARFGGAPGTDLAFVGRIAPEKGLVDAIEIAVRAGRRLRVAAKPCTSPVEREYFDTLVRPALRRAGHAVEWLGELTPADRDRLLADSAATLMPGAWPEPFGLVAIESLACGTPVVARPSGALPEIIRHGMDGWFAEEIDELVEAIDAVVALDRGAIRRSVLERFSAERMADAYEALFERAASGLAAGDARSLEPVGPGPTARVRPPILVSPVAAAQEDAGLGAPPRPPAEPAEATGGRSTG